MKAEEGSNWQALLNRWLSGRITAREERELDRLAEDDPFLAEALEGYRAHPEHDHNAKIRMLKERFEGRQDRRIFPLWRIAAAIAVLIVASVAMWQLSLTGGRDLAQMEPAMAKEAPPPETESLALQEATEMKPDVEEATDRPAGRMAPKSPASIPARPTPEPAEKNVAPVTAAPRITPPVVKPEEGVSRELALTKAPEPTSYDLTNSDQAELAKAPVAEEQTPTARAEEAPPVAAPAYTPSSNLYYAQTEITEAKNRRTKLVSGVIRSETGDPLPGATIRVPGTTRSALTEYDGRFSITVPVEAQQLQMTYLDEEQMLHIGGRDSFALDIENGELMETVVTGFGKRRSRKMESGAAPPPADTGGAGADMETPHPSVDSTLYRQYIRENLRYPDAARQAGISGEVTVQFSVSAEGKPNNFFMIRSLGYGCDEEAIRLIREGPAWIASENSIATYTIRFEP